MAAKSNSVLKAVVLHQLLADDDNEKALQHISEGAQMIAVFLDEEREARKTNPYAHVENFVEVVVPRYTPIQFKQHFRMFPHVFEELCEWIAPHLPAERTVPARKKMMATVWLLATTESYRSVADRFGFNKGELHNIVTSVCRTLTHLSKEIIKWPSSSELPGLAEDWQKKSGFPGVIGAVDGTYIQILGPCDDTRASWICRKGFPAMHLQVVCDSHMKLLDVTTGNVGSVHDSRVFRNSHLRLHLESENGRMPDNYHLLGDSAYPLRDYMLVPYKDNGHLTAAEKKYNYAHSSTRVIVEHSIGLLKGKFRRLKHLDMYKFTEVPYFIYACCVLHNFLLQSNERDEEDIDMGSVISDNTLDREDRNVINVSAAQKRRDITNALY